MIVQCRQCRTKFYFDDSQMQGDGLWMRCSRCGHVFFQSNPSLLKQEEEKPEDLSQVFSEDAVPDEKREDAYKDVSTSSRNDEDVLRFLDDVLETKKDAKEIEDEDFRKHRRERLDEDRFDIPRKDESFDESQGTTSEERPEKQKVKKSGTKGWKVFIWSFLVILAIPAVIYFVIYPNMGDHFIKIAHKYISDPEPARPQVIIMQVKIEDTRQRFVKNDILGEIRVMEGIAVNQADYPISRILIKGAIIDEHSKVLDEQTSYAGNILTDEELINLPAEEITKILSRPEGNNNANDKIMPNRQIPFMVVFYGEPQGVFKTTVTVIGAERLL